MLVKTDEISEDGRTGAKIVKIRRGQLGGVPLLIELSNTMSEIVEDQ